MVICHLYFQSAEGFESYAYPGYCADCGLNNRVGCSNCVNCGYCITPSGYGECVPGGPNGPYFRRDCIDYKYQEPISNWGWPNYYWPNPFYGWFNGWPNYWPNSNYYRGGPYYDKPNYYQRQKPYKKKYNKKNIPQITSEAIKQKTVTFAENH